MVVSVVGVTGGPSKEQMPCKAITAQPNWTSDGADGVLNKLSQPACCSNTGALL